eukprot:TRINITY_DN29332_c0_g1_i1.p1 TRINITY_DN29332_c0_g1~~TRINITY_DN29332_c0_g1_i1.p1  ORF type:complete len:239 (+),score=38.38 TRINITY_DN29332_c0_g1_i1:30-746(+)
MMLLAVGDRAIPIHVSPTARKLRLQRHSSNALYATGLKNSSSWSSTSSWIIAVASLVLGVVKTSATDSARRGLNRSFQRRTYSQVTLRAGTAMKLDIKQKVKDRTQTKTQKDIWAVLVHSKIRNCRMPWCKIPGLKSVVCTCLKEGVTPPANGGAAIWSKDGQRAFTVSEYAEVLNEGVSVLDAKKAYEVSSRLFESAMVDDVGTAMVIGADKKAALEYERKLARLGLWVSVAQMEGA